MSIVSLRRALWVLLMSIFFCLMLRGPPSSTRTDTLFPYTARFRSVVVPIHGLARVGNADDHLRLARKSGQQRGEARQQGRKQAHAAPCAHLPDRCDQLGVKHVILARGREASEIGRAHV